MDPPIITGTSLVHINTRDMVFRLCKECRSKIVGMTQEDNDMLFYCAKCQRTVFHFQASYATELTCYQNGLLVNYKVYDALEPLLGCDASTYCEILSEHPELPDHIREGIEGLMCHLLIREKREGKSSDVQVLDGIIPADPLSFEPILAPYLSNEQLSTHSQRQNDSSDDDIYYDA
ncbi:hypothetical protein LRAMOSA07747 [Lichtheimia ramosa]|uniref:Replication factor A C-terminal domain-containing protein n=1 Tax=Lichtheimia ramosa TaxID=688394 RepID=A0A077WDQ9_9FUNG|nr:hypothetical protein LRAMOSA07747 [Lichtheimia ramosa]